MGVPSKPPESPAATQWPHSPPELPARKGSPCLRSRRRCSDSVPAGGEGLVGDASRSSLDGDDFRLVFISSDSSSRDEDEPHSDDDEDDDEDDDDVGDCLSTSSGGAGPALDDCDWDYFEPSVAARDESPLSTPTPIAMTPVARRQRARAFLDGSPSSSDCSSSGSSVAEDNDNGVVLVTFRQIKDDAKQADDASDKVDAADDASDDAAEDDGGSERSSSEETAGAAERPGHEEAEDEKSSCASTSSDEDTNVELDSVDSVEDDDDSDDEAVSRTYRLRDGATLTQELDDSSSSRSSSSASDALDACSAPRHDEEDSDSAPFRV
ncbi:fibrinogen-binding protein-like [Thrips palmi]|uniref:Fibrinogen-binding protein-like n=1 Tax=Thrips palmi TaxID=161013 RepID=A0A6P8ZQ04_THRPL|nr:fibrinogen-binding protein-like [Thrips palmi]